MIGFRQGCIRVFDRTVSFEEFRFVHIGAEDHSFWRALRRVSTLCVVPDILDTLSNQPLNPSKS